MGQLVAVEQEAADGDVLVGESTQRLVRALVTLDPTEIERWAAAQGVPAAKTAEEIFSSTKVDAVLIATATPTHADYIEMAVAAGKAALCEKPIDLNLARVNACAAKIAGTKIPIQLGFNRRYDPGHSAARAAVLVGEIGDLHQVIITSRDPALPPRAYLEAAGGLFRDMTIHDFDLARFMLGEEPTEVFALGNALIDPKLAAELGGVDPQVVALAPVAGAPYFAQQELLGEQLARVAHEDLEHRADAVELGRAERASVVEEAARGQLDQPDHRADDPALPVVDRCGDVDHRRFQHLADEGQRRSCCNSQSR